MINTFAKTSGLALAAALALGVTAASAQVFSQRATTYFLDTSAGLSNTSTNYDNVITLPGGGNDSIGGTLSLRTGFTDLTFSTTGSVGTTYTVPPPGTPSLVGNVTNGGDGGTFGFNYNTANGPDFTTSWTKSEVLGGHDVLHFSGGGTNFLDLGGTYSLSIFITGDWSTLGLSAGDHVGFTHDPDFGVINNFVYNPTFDWTLLTLSTGSFTGANPTVDFFLVGDAIPGAPEPAAWALMLLGFGGLGGALRARRRSAALAAA
jgi:hypothetical protein